MQMMDIMIAWQMAYRDIQITTLLLSGIQPTPHSVTCHLL